MLSRSSKRIELENTAQCSIFLVPWICLTSPCSSSCSSLDNNNQSNVQIYLHSPILRRSKYFSALLSDRWQHSKENPDSAENKIDQYLIPLKLGVAPGSIEVHLSVLKLLYTNDFNNVINSAAAAPDILPVALKLLFDECADYLSILRLCRGVKRKRSA